MARRSHEDAPARLQWRRRQRQRDVPPTWPHRETTRGSRGCPRHARTHTYPALSRGGHTAPSRRPRGDRAGVAPLPAARAANHEALHVDDTPLYNTAQAVRTAFVRFPMTRPRTPIRPRPGGGGHPLHMAAQKATRRTWTSRRAESSCSGGRAGHTTHYPVPPPGIVGEASLARLGRRASCACRPSEERRRHTTSGYAHS